MTVWPNAINLNGNNWQFGSVAPAPLWSDRDLGEVRDWQPATVPGNLESDLIALGRMDDPCRGQSDIGARWVEDRDWWYRRPIPLTLSSGERAHLVLHGVDYYSATHANGQRLGRHEGMFSTQVYELTDALRDSGGRLDLAVRLWGAHALPQRKLRLWQRLAAPAVRRIAGDTDMFPARTRTLKCQMSFGWDFAPRLPVIGIWDDAEVVVSGPSFISDIQVQAVPHGAGAYITVGLTMHSTIAGPARVTLSIQGDDPSDDVLHFTFSTALHAGQQMARFSMHMPSARLWQPWDRGEPSLYHLTAHVQPQGDAISSTAATTFGVRSLAMAGAQNAQGSADWTFVINGRQEFVRGVNWTPADVLPGRVSAGDYSALITLAKEANANLLRVWGGGLREKRAFYDLCDRAGMLVWQELPLACPNLLHYPRDSAFLSLVSSEVGSIVHQLRNHPSVVLWCGGNEFGPAKNRQVVQTIARAVSENDGTRPFRAASPSAGDRHDWRVWHHFAPLSAYVHFRARLVSEFGLQSVPSLSSLRSFIPPGELWPPGPSWQTHNADLAKLRHYAAPHLRIAGAGSAQPADTGNDLAPLERFIAATQQAQARGVQMMVEHMRWRKPETSGVIVWQLNEPWPSICWSLLAYDRQPKLAYHMLRRVFNPLLVSVEYDIKQYNPGDAVHLRLWVINDLSVPPSPCTLSLTLNGSVVHTQPVALAPDSSRMVCHVIVHIPGQPGPWLLRAELHCGEQLLSENEYDLSYFDERQTPLVHRLLALFGHWLLQ